MVNVRKTAVKLLQSYESEGRYVNLLLSSHELDGFSREQRAQLTALLYTAVEHKLSYDHFISVFASRPARELDPYIRNLLRIGLCQIIDIDSIPDFAAVNETVKLARHGGEAAFVNAVLRRAVKERGKLPYPDRAKNPARYLSIRYSVPQGTVKFFISVFGEEQCERLLSSYSESAPLSITVNERRTSREELISRFAECGIGAVPTKYTKNGIELDASYPPRSLAGYASGDFFVQDESSRIAHFASAPSVGDVVVDVCAAPGGKSLAAAIAVGERGKVYSFDLHESKLSLISDSAERLGIADIMKIAAHDATEPIEELIGKADRVICDVPCSGLGVFRKKPDLRYKDISDITELVPIQEKILSASAKYLKAGGVLVYSTCTLNPAENEGVTDAFVAAHPDFAYEGFEVGELYAPCGKLTLLPHVHGTDGFYVAKLRKIQTEENR